MYYVFFLLYKRLSGFVSSWFFQDFKDDYFLKKLTFGKCKSMQCTYLKILARKAHERTEVKIFFYILFFIYSVDRQ